MPTEKPLGKLHFFAKRTCINCKKTLRSRTPLFSPLILKFFLPVTLVSQTRGQRGPKTLTYLINSARWALFLTLAAADQQTEEDEFWNHFFQRLRRVDGHLSESTASWDTSALSGKPRLFWTLPLLLLLPMWLLIGLTLERLLAHLLVSSPHCLYSTISASLPPSLQQHISRGVARWAITYKTTPTACLS